MDCEICHKPITGPVPDAWVPGVKAMRWLRGYAHVACGRRGWLNAPDRPPSRSTR